MPYKDKSKDRQWHKEYMRKARGAVTPVTPKVDVTPEPLRLVTPKVKQFTGELIKSRQTSQRGLNE